MDHIIIIWYILYADINIIFKITQPMSLSKLAALMRMAKGITLTKMKNMKFCAEPMVTQPQ